MIHASSNRTAPPAYREYPTFRPAYRGLEFF